MSKPLSPPLKRYVLLRRYRGAERVVEMYLELDDAEAAFEDCRRELRAGDLVLAEATLTKLKVESGGYNRTRW